MKFNSLFLCIFLSSILLATFVYRYKVYIIANYIQYTYNQTHEYNNYALIKNNHTFRYCTTYIYKDSNGFHVWAELDCGPSDYFKTHVFGNRKVEAQILTSKEPGLTMGGHETISGIFPIDIFNQANFGKYNLITNNCRTYLVILHRILESFPHFNKKYKNEPVTELLNVNIGVDYSNLMSEITFKKIQQAIANMF